MDENITDEIIGLASKMLASIIVFIVSDVITAVQNVNKEGQLKTSASTECQDPYI
jgi:hypothetical protein